MCDKDNNLEEDEDEDNVGTSSAEFCLLRPLCVAVMNDVNEMTLSAFQEGFSLLQSPPPHLSQYVLFPFVVHLKRMSELRDKVKTKLVLCLNDVVSKFDVSWPMFVELFNHLHRSIAESVKEGGDPTKLNTRIPEDLMDAVVRCIDALYRRNMTRYATSLVSEDNVKMLAHSIRLLLEVANAEVERTMRLRAMDIVLLYISNCQGKEAESQRMFFFLPGIVSTASKVANTRKGIIYKDAVQKGISLIEQSVCATVEYMDNSSLAKPDTYLSVVLSEMGKQLVLHDEINFRLSFLELSEKTLSSVSKKMPGCRQALLSNLLVLKNDPDVVIRERVAKILGDYKDYVTIEFEDLEELLQNALIQLQGKDEDSCLRSLSKVNSYLASIKLNCFEIERTLDLIFSVINDSGIGKRGAIPRMPRIGDNHVIRLCSSITENVLSSGNVIDILDICAARLISFEGDFNTNFLGCVKFFNTVLSVQIKGRSDGACEIPLDQLRQFVDLYMQLMDVQSTEVMLSALESQAPKTQSLVDILKAELLVGLGLMGKLSPMSMGLLVLYPLIENASLNSSPIVAEAAQDALNQLSSPLPLSDFLTANLHHVISEVTVRILNLSLYPNSPNALMFLAKYFDFSKSSLITVIDQALSRSCDPFSGGQQQLLYAQVFYAFLQSLLSKCTMTSGDDIQNKSVTSFLSHTTIKQENFYEFLCHHQRALGLDPGDILATQNCVRDREDKGNVDENDIDMDSDRTTSMEESTKKLPPDLELTHKICRRVLNFLPNNNRVTRLLAMDCLTKGLELLRYEENILLPLAHTVWQNLVPRIMEEDYVVVRKAFELLLCLCSTCGSFLKKRTLEEVFPKLSRLLTDLALESEQVKEINRVYYTCTQAYKLQLTVLQGLAELCKCVDIQEEDLHKVVDGCLLYLKPQQNKNLRAASTELLNALTNENSCTKYKTVWMKLIAHALRPLPSDPATQEFTPIPDRIVASFHSKLPYTNVCHKS